MHKNLIRLASVLMIIGIILGAFGAHFLKAKISERLIEAYKTGVLYHLLHAIAILAIGLSNLPNSKNLIRAKNLLLIGITLFSGSLYLLSLKEIVQFPEFLNFIGILTPIGGISFISGWIFLIRSLNQK